MRYGVRNMFKKINKRIKTTRVILKKKENYASCIYYESLSNRTRILLRNFVFLIQGNVITK